MVLIAPHNHELEAGAEPRRCHAEPDERPRSAIVIRNASAPLFDTIIDRGESAADISLEVAEVAPGFPEDASPCAAPIEMMACEPPRCAASRYMSDLYITLAVRPKAGIPQTLVDDRVLACASILWEEAGCKEYAAIIRAAVRWCAQWPRRTRRQ